MSARKITTLFNKRIFWDVDLDTLDMDAKSTFIIERVFERGDIEDVRQCRRYYGDSLVRTTLLKTKFLPMHRLHLASAIIDEPITSFTCYTLRQSNPGLYPY